MIKEWVINQDDFERFLAWLNPNPDEAARKYEGIRRRLVKLFESRGFSEAEEMADDTFDRVIRKAPEIVDTYVGDPALYCYGVAHYVLLERCRKPPASLPVPLPDHWDEREPRFACLDDCMKELSTDDRQLVLSYYADDGRAKIERRQELAEKLRVSDNALRIRLCRIRATLKDCINECLKQQGR
jgi:DNA-directed RNA polymerase specialized sigma24 family protein